MRALVSDAGLEARWGSTARARGLARGRSARRAFGRRGGAARDHDRRCGAPGHVRGLRALRPARRDGRLERDRAGEHRADDAGRREGSSAARVRSRVGWPATSTSPIPTTARATASSACSTWSTPPVAGCSRTSALVSPPAEAARRGARVAGRDCARSAGGDLNEAYAADLDGRPPGLRQDRRRCRTRRLRDRGRRAALARRAAGAPGCRAARRRRRTRRAALPGTGLDRARRSRRVDRRRPRPRARSAARRGCSVVRWRP